MKRTRLYLLTALVALTLLVCSAFCYWVAGTTNGTRWLLQVIGDRADLEITIGTINGRLADHLDIEGLRLDWGEGGLEISRLQIDWQPWNLLGGRLVIHVLTVDQVALSVAKDDTAVPPVTTETTTLPAEIDLTVCPEWLTVIIEKLEIKGFVYRDDRVDDPDVVIADRIAGHYRLTHKRLLAEGFAYHSPYVNVDGSLDWALEQPHLVMETTVYLPPTCVDPDLFETIRVPVRFPAYVELDGTWEGYRGPARFGHKDKNNETVWLNANLDGSWRGIKLEALQGGYLQGTITGQLKMSWVDAYLLQGTITGQQLQLDDFVDELQGATTLEVNGKLSVPYADQPFTAQLATTVTSAHVRDQAVHGRAAADWLGTHLTRIDVDLSSQGSRLLAQGVPDEKVVVELTAEDLSVFHPEFTGQVLADGWLRWTDDTLTGSVTGRATELHWQDFEVQRLDFSANHPVAAAEIDLRFGGRHLKYHDRTLAALESHISGTPASHRIELLATDPQGSVKSQLQGQYREDHWEGLLLNLDARNTSWGDWRLAESAKLSLRPGNLHLDTLQLAGEDAARINLATLTWQEERGISLDLSWSAVSLEWLAPLIGIQEVNGRTEGQFIVETDASGPINLTGHLVASGHLEHDTYELDYRELDVDLAWDTDGLQFSASGRSDREETLSAKVTSSDPPRWTWPANLVVDATWQQLALARFNRFSEDLTLDGHSQGMLHLETVDHRPQRISARVSAESHLQILDQDLGSRSLLVDLHWEEQRFNCAARLTNPAGGAAELRLVSEDNPVFGWPVSGKIQTEIEGLQLALLSHWLPSNLQLSGRYDGKLEGTWQNHQEIDLTGHLDLSDSDVRWSTAHGHLRLPLRKGRLDLQWRGQHLLGSTAVNLGDKGQVNATWQLPLPARLPINFDPQQPIQASLTAKVRAIGIFSMLGQWAMEDTQGDLAADLTLGGTWAIPVLGGEVTLSNGSGYLPATGIRIEDVGFRTELIDERIVLRDLSLRAGKGTLTGEGEMSLDHWHPREYRLTLAGKNLQVYDFPEIQAVVDPDLELSGNPKLLKMRGHIQVPHLLVKTTGSTAIASSKDVVVAQPGDEPEKRLLAFETDVSVTVGLGEDVRVHLGGVQSYLEGEATVTLGPDGTPLVWGEVRLTKGEFRAYGTNLKIQQGILRYKGDPVDNPQLSILAVRETANVKAGVQVGGNGESPVINLYSQPVMPERDIISYILTGQATSKEGKSEDDLMIGAGSLLPSDYQSKLGVTEVLLQGIYVGTGGVRLRYRLADRWELESTLGVESGVDLYYIFTFD